jgi:hypothetical protein
MVHLIMVVAVGVLVLNIPFGFWRVGVRKFSVPWFLAVHLPIPCIVALRLYSGLGWSLASFPFVMGAYVTGQYLGGLLRSKVTSH